MANPVVHFEIGGPDQQALIDFYTGLFDWKVEVTPPTNYGMVHTHEEGDAGIDGGIPQQEGGQEGPWVTVYIAVPDPQATLDAAVAAGAEVLMPVTEMPQVTMALFKDPAGNPIGIIKDAM